MNFKSTRLFLSACIAAGLFQFVAPEKVSATIFEADVSSEMTNPLNWAGNVLPDSSTGLGEFVDDFMVNPTVTGAFNIRYIQAGDGNVPGGGGGARVFSGTGTIGIGTGGGNNGNIDTYVASGPWTFNNASLELRRVSDLYAASGVDGIGAGSNPLAELNINTTTFFAGVGGGTGPGNASFNAVGANINITPVVDFSKATQDRQLFLVPFASRKVTLTNGVGSSSRLTRINVTGQANGTAILGANNTSWAGTVIIGASGVPAGGADLEITSNTSLGAPGNVSASYTEILNGVNGSLVMSGGITTGEYIFLDQRDATSSAHIKNKSGTNVISNAIELERGGGAIILSHSSWILESAGTAPTDFLSITGNVYTPTLEGTVSTSSGTGTLILQGAGKGSISGNISQNTFASVLNTFGITKRGSGTWTLSGTNVYSSPTTVEAGTLIVNGSNSGGASYTVSPNATLGGNGNINVLSVLSQGILSPGSLSGLTTLGQLNFVNSGATVTSNGDLFIEYDTSLAAQIDVLDVNGTLNFGPASSITFSDIGTDLDGTSSYVFGNYGTLAGSIPTFNNLPVGYKVDFSGGNLTLVPVPEPSTFVLASLIVGSVCYGLRRHRRIS